MAAARFNSTAGVAGEDRLPRFVGGLTERTLHDGVTIWSQVPTRSLAILALHWRLDHVNRSDTDYRDLERLSVRKRIANEGLARP